MAAQHVRRTLRTAGTRWQGTHGRKRHRRRSLSQCRGRGTARALHHPQPCQRNAHSNVPSQPPRYSQALMRSCTAVSPQCTAPAILQCSGRESMYTPATSAAGTKATGGNREMGRRTGTVAAAAGTRRVATAVDDRFPVVVAWRANCTQTDALRRRAFVATYWQKAPHHLKMCKCRLSQGQVDLPHQSAMATIAVTSDKQG